MTADSPVPPPDPLSPTSAARPQAILRDVEVFLGEALREVLAARRKRPAVALASVDGAVHAMALSLAFGRAAVTRALTARLEDKGSAARIGVAATGMVAAAVGREIAPILALPLGVAAAAAGVGWLATMRRVTPLRRRYAEHVSAARRDWEAGRKAWLEGTLSREAREAEVKRLIDRLARAVID